MNNQIDFKKLEMKAYLATYQDGLWEIWFGLFLVGSSISSLLATSDFLRILNTLVVALAIPFLVFWFGKKRITTPRLGLVKFGEKRRAKRKKFGIFMLALNLPVLLLWILSSSNSLPDALRDWLNTYYGSPVAFSLIVLIFFIAGGAITGLRRFYLYGIILATGMFFFELSYIYNRGPIGHFLPYCISGGLLLMIGIINLIKFIRRYPEEKNDNVQSSR